MSLIWLKGADNEGRLRYTMCVGLPPLSKQASTNYVVTKEDVNVLKNDWLTDNVREEMFCRSSFRQQG